MRPVALITGANRGIGREIASQLSAKGFRVLAGARDAEEGQAAAEAMTGTWLPLDCVDPESVQEAADWARTEVGTLDVLINNAGALLDEGLDLFTLDEAAFRATLDVNLLGAWRVTKAFAPLLNKGGRIINISSGGGQISSMGTWAPAYCISKAALNALTVQLAQALQGRGIAVNAACPGWVRTRMGGNSAPLSAQEGADTPVWLATEAPQSLSGAFFRNRKKIPW